MSCTLPNAWGLPKLDWKMTGEVWKSTGEWQAGMRMCGVGERSIELSRGWSCSDDGVKSLEKWGKPVAQRSSTNVPTHLEVGRILGSRVLGKKTSSSRVCPLFTYSVARVPLQSRERTAHLAIRVTLSSSKRTSLPEGRWSAWCLLALTAQSYSQRKGTIHSKSPNTISIPIIWVASFFFL